LARTGRLEVRRFNGPPEVDPADDPQRMAEQLSPMAKSITNAFASIAAMSTIERCELAAAQLHQVSCT